VFLLIAGILASRVENAHSVAPKPVPAAGKDAQTTAVAALVTMAAMGITVALPKLLIINHFRKTENRNSV
jgi:hypothetical protein